MMSAAAEEQLDLTPEIGSELAPGVALALGAHRYEVPCAAEEQPRLEHVAALVEEGARALADSGAAEPAPEGEDPDRRFLALLSLLLADQLFEAQEALRQLAPEPEAYAAPGVADAYDADAAAYAQDAAEEEVETISQELSDALTELLESAARRMEALAEKFEASGR